MPGEDFASEWIRGTLTAACNVIGRPSASGGSLPSAGGIRWPQPRAKRAITLRSGAIVRDIRYLGLTIDERWRFRIHLEGVARRVEVRAAVLGCLLPNLDSPGTKVRRLYANTVQPVALYGAPVWADTLVADRRGHARMTTAHRPIAANVARAYRIVSHAAATAIVDFPTLEIVTAERARAFRDTRNPQGRPTVGKAAHRTRRRLQH
ncbi:hypothetical protein KM043_000127 [Ampulex compressa]|nr:hypothetical protein KM043_000127 [Ampulex compressa]